LGAQQGGRLRARNREMKLHSRYFICISCQGCGG
jgi:hypothetical protein